MPAADRRFPVNTTDQASSSKIGFASKNVVPTKPSFRNGKKRYEHYAPDGRFLSDNRSSGQPEILEPLDFGSRYPGLDPGLPGMKRAGCLRLPEQFIRLPISALLLVAKIVRLGSRLV